MEATPLVLRLSLILLLFFTINGVSAGDGKSFVEKHPAVLDISGNELQKGVYYYLLPVITLPRLQKAAIILGVYSPGTCWVQLEVETHTHRTTGLPVKFSPTILITEDESIRESVDLNIRYSDELSPVCGGSSMWKVDKFGLVSLGGAEEDRSSWFKIEKASENDGRVYKLVSSSDSQVVRDIGISTSDETRRLALANEPLGFVFKALLKDGPSASK